jgi:hypothetical protein
MDLFNSLLDSLPSMESRSASSPSLENTKTTPIPVILARSIQKFFSDQMGTSRPNSDLDVKVLLEDIDTILDGRSLEDGNLLLRGIVADLLREIDLLRFRLDETTKTLQRVKEERDIVNHDYRDRLLALTLALSSHDADTADELHQKCRTGAIVSPDEATTLTIQTLTKKIEMLNLQVGKQEEQLRLRRERIDDLEADNQILKMAAHAIERQFNEMCTKDSPRTVVRKVAEVTHSPTSVAASSLVEAPSPASTVPKIKATWQPPPKSFVPKKMSPMEHQIPAHGAAATTSTSTPPTAKKFVKAKLVKLVDISS